jgi:hypothetical protein
MGTEFPRTVTKTEESLLRGRTRLKSVSMPERKPRLKANHSMKMTTKSLRFQRRSQF